MRQAIQFGILIFFLVSHHAESQDLWQYYEHTNFEKYKTSNEKVKLHPDSNYRVVFMGKFHNRILAYKKTSIF